MVRWHISNKDQNWLVPQRIRDMIPNDHICFLVEDFVNTLDYSRHDEMYDGAGHPAYHPRISMKILVYGMLCKVRSSRKLAKACMESFIFIYLSEKTDPDFRTISRFRKDNSDFAKEAFKKTVKTAVNNKLVDLSFISIDGTMMKANSSKKRYLDKKGLDKLDKAVEKMIQEDIELDELEDELYGDNANDGRTGMDRRDMKKIVKEYFKNKPKVKEKINRAEKELDNFFLKKVSITDPESRMMQNKKTVREPSYNAQFTVSKNQIIVANDVCQDGHDAHQFVPQIENVKQNIKLKRKTKVGCDCGYSDGINIKFAEDNEIDLYVPSRAQAQEFDGKEQTLNHDKYDYDSKRDEIIENGYRYRFRKIYVRKTGKKIRTYYCKELKKKKDVPYYFKERLRMKAKMERPESQKIYHLRKITVEPVIGHLKQNMGFTEFLLRGLENVKIELNLACIAHNLQKIWRLKVASGC